jgi:hypothetical protein
MITPKELKWQIADVVITKPGITEAVVISVENALGNSSRTLHSH